MTFDDGLASCPLVAGPFPREARRCDWCGAGLSSRRTRWCSDPCSAAYARNHSWTSARAAAVERDGRRCVRCGADGDRPDARAWHHLLILLAPPPRPPTFLDWARFHGVDSSDPEAWREGWLVYRTAVRAVEAPWSEAREILATLLRLSALEVNHKTPVLGRHSDTGCHHHLDGLETLCHACHLIETATQRAAGLLG